MPSNSREKGSVSPIRLAGFAAVLLVIVLAILLPDLLRKRLATSEESASGTLRMFHRAETEYARLYGGFSPDLRSLGPPAAGSATDAANAGLLDEFHSARRSDNPSRVGRGGYVYTYLPSGTFPSIRSYAITADPAQRGVSAQWSYFIDHTGVVRRNQQQTASATDPPLE